MAKTNPIWKHIGNNWYQLNEGLCYIGTNVFVVPRPRGRFTLRLVNYCDDPQSDCEVHRIQGQVDSKKTWRTPNGAKRLGMSISKRKDWLEKAGIEFKSPEPDGWYDPNGTRFL